MWLQHCLSAGISLLDLHNNVTRGHHLKLFKNNVRYDLRKYYVVIHIISIRKYVPDNVTNANTVGVFKNRLDHF